MPQLRSPIDALRYALARQQGARETGGMIARGIDRGVERRDRRAERQSEEDYRAAMMDRQQQWRNEDLSRAAGERGEDLEFRNRTHADALARQQAQDALEARREDRYTQEGQSEATRKWMEMLGGGAKNVLGGAYRVIGDIRKGTKEKRDEERKEEAAVRQDQAHRLRIHEAGTKERDDAIKNIEALIADKEKMLESHFGDKETMRSELASSNRAKRKQMREFYRNLALMREKMPGMSGLADQTERMIPKPEWFDLADEIDDYREELANIRKGLAFGAPQQEEPAAAGSGVAEAWR